MADLISRAAAIKAVEEYLQGLDSCISEDKLKLDGYRNGLQVAMYEVNNAPAVDAAPVVHARWRDTGSGQECSACNEIQYGYDTGRFYCPNCGAKMDGERRESE